MEDLQPNESRVLRKGVTRVPIVRTSNPPKRSFTPQSRQGSQLSGSSFWGRPAASSRRHLGQQPSHVQGVHSSRKGSLPHREVTRLESIPHTLPIKASNLSSKVPSSNRRPPSRKTHQDLLPIGSPVPNQEVQRGRPRPRIHGSRPPSQSGKERRDTVNVAHKVFRSSERVSPRKALLPPVDANPRVGKLSTSRALWKSPL